MQGGDATRAGVAGAVLPSPATLWTFNKDSLNRTITFVGPSAVVCSRELVYAVGSVIAGSQKQYSLYAVDRRTGTLAWSRSVAAPIADSWSSPVFDEHNGAVIVCTGKQVQAFDARSGSPRWTTTLPRNIVNASPVVTSDLGVSNRLFITQYDGFGTAGLLTCINIDPVMGVANPFAPGELLWSAAIGGSSGNSPAYCAGVVYCASVGVLDVYGQVQAFDARATAVPPPLWTHVIEGHNSFGGVSVHADAAGLWLYAASYDFAGGLDASVLCKIDAFSGDEVWSVPCNRTAAAPVVVGDGRIVLSGGVWGYGTVPSIEVFVDGGTSASRAWHSALDTWVDSSGDEELQDGEFLALGGWSHAPLMLEEGHVLVCGAAPVSTDPGSAYTSLTAIDLDHLPPAAPWGGPLDRSFVRWTNGACGSSPAAADATLYSIGGGGLCALGTPPGRYDVNGDDLVDIEDLYWWHQGRGARDTDGDGDADPDDLRGLTYAVRSGEGNGAAR